jgi:hypothetical protein
LILINIYAIANQSEIIVICEPLGDIHGYFHIVENQKMIHLNEKLTSKQRKIIMCKLLYSYFQGESFDLIHAQTELSRREIYDMIVLNEFAVHRVFNVFSMTRNKIEHSNEQIMKRFIRTNGATYSDLLKTVS